MKRIKQFDELTITDDFMFCKVLSHNEELCRELIELIMGKKIKILRRVDTQKSIEITRDGKGIRMDVVMEGDDTIYDLEMQNSHKQELPRRSRYYQAMTDLDLMSRGMEYGKLSPSVIIFLCTFDPLGKGLSRYTVKPCIEEAPEVEYNDGTRKVFLSTLPGQDGEISRELRAVLDYINGGAPGPGLAERLRDAVQRAKSQQDWRKEYMLLEEKYREFLEEGREEGKELGRQEGREEGREEGILSVAGKMKAKGMSAEEIAELTELPIARIEAL